MRWIWILGLIVIMAVVASSCSPEKRLARIVDKHPELLRKDTLTLRDTIYRAGSVRDSVFIFSGDTVYIRNDRQEIKYFYNTTNQHHYIKGEVKGDTVFYEKKVPYEKVVVQRSGFWSGFKWGFFGSISVFLILVILAFLRWWFKGVDTNK